MGRRVTMEESCMIKHLNKALIAELIFPYSQIQTISYIRTLIKLNTSTYNYMRLTQDIKKEIIKKHGKTEKDTGSPETQIALFSEKINYLTEHL